MADAVVRARTLDGFGATVEELGGDSSQVLRASGLPSTRTGNPDNWIPFPAVLDAYEIASRQTGCPHFGMHLAASRDLAYLGPLILIFKYSPTLKDGLQAVTRYTRIQNSGYTLSLEPARDSMLLRFVLPDNLRQGACQWIEESLLAALKALQLFLGDSFQPQGVMLSHRRIGRPEDYRRYFGTDPEFEAKADALVFDKDALESSNPRDDSDIVRFLDAYLRARVPPHDGNTVAAVRALLADLIPTGNYSIDVVAHHLKIHRRTLQRRLANAGVRYADLLDSCRASMAAEYLEGSRLPIVNLAHMLGYSDQSAFNHAFRRWHGVSPTVWAERNQSIVD